MLISSPAFDLYINYYKKSSASIVRVIISHLFVIFAYSNRGGFVISLFHKLKG